MTNTPYIEFFFLTKNPFRFNLIWNLPQNFHEDRLIIQGRSMYFMFFDIMTTFIPMVVALTRCEGHFVGYRKSHRAVIRLASLNNASLVSLTRIWKKSESCPSNPRRNLFLWLPCKQKRTGKVYKKAQWPLAMKNTRSIMIIYIQSNALYWF